MASATRNTPTQDAEDNNIILPIQHPKEGPKAYKLEIDEFLADNDMTNLFLLALEALHKNSLAKENGDVNWWSFYSLSTIHGAPREDWAGYPNAVGNGYCHHGASTFPTWHRPYMYQFEQAVYNQMLKIANTFNDPSWKSRMVAACSRFRLPYWDVCMPRNKDPNRAPEKVRRSNSWRWGFPKIFKKEEVHVRRPDSPGELVPMPNPLYTFTFPTAEDFDNDSNGRPQINWDRTGLSGNGSSGAYRNFTIRAPTDNEGSNYNQLEERIQLQTQELSTSIWQLLNPNEQRLDRRTGKIGTNQTRPWSTFANHFVNGKSGDRFPPSVSLESWHDSVHVLLGLGVGYRGHMIDPGVAAFDPAFWMHHNNVERLLALYQALYPDKYVEKELVNNELLPFKKSDAGDCHTSTDIQDWKKTGYAIPGDEPLDATGRQKVTEYLRDNYYWATDATDPPSTLNWPKDLSQVEALTGTPATTQPPKPKIKALSRVNGGLSFVTRQIPLSLDATAKVELVDPNSAQESIDKSLSKLPAGALLDADRNDIPTKMRTWNALFRVKKYAFDGSFVVHFFIGYVKDNQSERFMTKMNEAGFSGIFASTEQSGCQSCEKNRDEEALYEDAVPLTSKLLDYLESSPNAADLIRDGQKKTIRDLEPAEVVPFLKEHLQWRITDSASNLLEVEGSSLEVEVVDRLFEPPTLENPLGTYGISTVHAEITQGKVGGFNG